MPLALMKASDSLYTDIILQNEPRALIILLKFTLSASLYASRNTPSTKIKCLVPVFLKSTTSLLTSLKKNALTILLS